VRAKTYWIVTLVAALALSAAAVLYCRMLDRFEMAASKVGVLRHEVHSLESAIEQTRHTQNAVREWKGLLDAAQQAGLSQKGWRTYPVSVSRELTWDELSTLILIASNGKPRGDAYWFQPELLRVVRVVTGGEKNEQDNASKQSHEKRYRVRLKGDFLIAVP